jgi:hypothetical protein
MVTYNSTANYGPSQFIVSSVVGQGNYNTIQAAINAAAAVGGPQTVIIQDGTYTGNLNIPVAITLTSASGNCQQFTAGGGTGVTIASNTTIAGTTGEVRLVGVELVSNGAGPLIIFTATGASSALTIENCYLNSTFTGILCQSADPAVNIINSTINVTTGSVVSNGGSTVNFYNSSLSSTSASNAMIGTSGTATINLYGCTANSSNLGAGGAVSVGAAGVTVSSYNTSWIAAGAVVAFAAAGSAIFSNSIINCAATNYVTGAGTFSFSSLSFQNTDVPDPATTMIPLENAVGQSLFPVGASTTFIEGTNACSGVTTLVMGTSVVSTNQVQLNSRYIFSSQGPNASTSIGTLALTAFTTGTSFTVSSLTSTGLVNVGDLSTVYWQIVQSV